MDRNHLNKFERWPTKDNSCEVWLKSNQWFRRCLLKKLFTDARMMDGWMHIRRTKCDYNSSSHHYMTGELKSDGDIVNASIRSFNRLFNRPLSWEGSCGWFMCTIQTCGEKSTLSCSSEVEFSNYYKKGGGGGGGGRWGGRLGVILK